MKWKYFGGAAILATGLLLKFGAPLVPVVLGLVLAGGMNWLRLRSSGHGPKSGTPMVI